MIFCLSNADFSLYLHLTHKITCAPAQKFLHLHPVTAAVAFADKWLYALRKSVADRHRNDGQVGESTVRISYLVVDTLNSLF